MESMIEKQFEPFVQYHRQIRLTQPDTASLETPDLFN